MRRSGLYARVSTSDQEPENQLAVLRAYALARGWRATEYVDHGVSGAKTRRPHSNHGCRYPTTVSDPATICLPRRARHSGRSDPARFDVRGRDMQPEFFGL